MKIYFLPFAGGSDICYNKLIHNFIKNAIVPVQCSLPGRGGRLGEELLDSIPALAQDVFRQITASFDGGPYAIFGHSMGASIAVHVLSLLKKSEFPLPVHVFLSGKSGVVEPDKPPFKCEMSVQDLKNTLSDLGGIPKVLIVDDDFMSFFEPIIRKDFRAIEHYLPVSFHDSKLKVTVYFSDGDKLSAEDVFAWQRITAEKIDGKCFSGGHFFIFDHAKEIVKDVLFKLKP
ncbi:MAG: surfactin synthase thioesterase subunit [Saprospiraceae bacterium]|jgi:surfactin synthase thioesterase subunit